MDGQNWNTHFDQQIGSRDKLVFQYGYMGEKVIAFQLVAGQNPDTTGFSNDGRVTWHRDWTSSYLHQRHRGLRSRYLAVGRRAGTLGPSIMRDRFAVARRVAGRALLPGR